jgi:hypothetical protein
MEDCPVCCEKYNKSGRRVISCFCGFKVCYACASRYLLDSINDPECMSCKARWTRRYMADVFPKAFITGKYKQHRENVLFDRQKAFAESTQSEIIRQKAIEENSERLREIKEQVRNLYIEKNRIESTLYNLRRSNNTNETVRVKSEFLCHCPSECNGMILTATKKCSMCDKKVCQKCREFEHDDDCDPNTLESLAALRKDTKPCPKCSVPINKYVGCDQSFCTQCKTLFSWRTLEIVTSGAMHNPHYLDWIATNRASNNIVRNNNGGCFDFGDRHNVSWMLRRVSDSRVRGIVQFTNHIEANFIRDGATIDYDVDFLSLRCDYVTKSMSEEEYKRKIQQMEKRKKKRMEEISIMNNYIEVLRDTMIRYMDLNNPNMVSPTTETIDEMVDFISRFTKETNKALAIVGDSYSNKCLQISKSGNYYIF